MANLKEVRIRIASVDSTKQITSAMKMVSASKLRRAQNAILKLRPYAVKLKVLLANASEGVDSVDNAYSKERKIKNVLIVAVSSNRGLCGAFNANVIKTVNILIASKYSELNKKGNVSIMTIGKKATEFFVKKKYNVVEYHNDITDSLSFDKVVPIAEKLMSMFKTGKYDRIEIVYNQFKNATSQVLTTETFLPLIKEENKANTVVKSSAKTDYIYEPSKEVIITELIPKTLKIQLYKAVLDSVASEHGARMTAMHKATDNATEMLKELRLSYNKARQAAITKEILEIVSGANALEG